MKNKPIFILTILLLVVLHPSPGAFGAESGEAAPSANPESGPAQAETLEAAPDDAISRLKLRADSLPEGMEILGEARATNAQLTEKRRRVGFRLVALLGQTIAHGDERTQVNYIILPDKTDINLAFSNLVAERGHESMIVKKNGILIQMDGMSAELENRLIFLLKIDPLQASKIRFHRSPQEWKLSAERFLKPHELKAIEQKTGVMIQQGLLQKMLINRTEVKIHYYDCETERLADLVGENLATGRRSVEKRTVRGYGRIVVTVDSSSDKLNNTVLSYMN